MKMEYIRCLCFYVLLLLTEIGNGITCDPPDPTFDYYKSITFNYDFINAMSIYQSKFYPDSGNAYHYIDVNNTDDIMIIKTDSNDDIIWYTHTVSPGVIHGFDVAPDESSIVYMEDTTAAILYQLNATDASFMNAQKNTNMYPEAFSSHLSFSDDSSGVWFISRQVATGFLCKWGFTTTSFGLSYPLVYYGAVNSINAINASVSYVTIERKNNLAVEVNKIDFDVTSDFFVYTSMIQGSYCQTKKDSLYLDSANNRIYTSVIHDNDFLFGVLEMSTGNQAVGTNVYRSNNACTDVNIFRMHMNDNKVYIPANCNLPTLFVYDTLLDQFDNIYQPSSSLYFFRNIYFKDSRIYFTGHQTVGSVNNAWIVNTNPDAIETIPQIISAVSSFPITIDTTPSHTPTVISYSYSISTTQSLTTQAEQIKQTGNYELLEYQDSRIRLEIISETISNLNELHIGINRTITLSGSITGDTPLSYQIIANGAAPIPAWVTLDATNQILTMDTPDVSISETFSLQIQTTYSYYSDLKTIYINVVECIDSGCEQGTADPNQCNLGDSGLILDPVTFVGYDNNTQDVVSSEINSAIVVSQAAIGTSFGVGILAIITSSSSSNSAFASLNQFQLYMLVPLVGTKMHKNVIDYIEGFEFTSFSFSIINAQNLKFMSSFFKIDNQNSYMNEIGIQSLGTIYNIFSILIVLIVLGVIHSCIVIPIYSGVKAKTDQSKIKKVFNLMMTFFTFAVYIRIIVESYQLMVMSSINEMYTYEDESSAKVVSLVFTGVFLILSVVLVFGVFYLVKHSFKSKFNKNESYFKEFFDGIKNTKWARIYFSLFMLRRLLSIALTIFLESLPLYSKITFFVILHILVTFYIIIVKPFDNHKDNMIEIIHEIGFAILVISLFYFDSNEKWTTKSANTVVYILGYISVITAVIGLSFFVVSTYKSIRKWLSKSKQIKVKPIDSATEISNMKSMHTDKLTYNSNNDEVFKRYHTQDLSTAQINPNGITLESKKTIKERHNSGIFK